MRKNCVLHDIKTEPMVGLIVAGIIMFVWSGSLTFLLFVDIAQWMPLCLLPAILGRTFIQTGLFIVAHDAIHGVVLPSDRRLNDGIGQLALMLYAFLPYKHLSLNHNLHHQNPGQVGDPDFHDGVHGDGISWYLKFMKGYLDAKQRMVLLLWMSVVFYGFHLGLHVPTINLFLFWILPLILSSMQLFLFGTYMPHRSPRPENNTSHNAVSSNYPLILSFLTCYHFGYHWEHHEYPFLPWYKLPSAYFTIKQ